MSAVKAKGKKAAELSGDLFSQPPSPPPTQGGEPPHKLLVNRFCRQVFSGMHLLVECDAATVDHHGGSQPVPFQIRTETRPVHDNQHL